MLDVRTETSPACEFRQAMDITTSCGQALWQTNADIKIIDVEPEAPEVKVYKGYVSQADIILICRMDVQAVCLI